MRVRYSISGFDISHRHSILKPNYPSVDVDKDPCGTVLESAKIHHEMLTGLVVTSRITHATPASFSAHVVDRDMEDQIASQQLGDNPLGRTVDLLLGGGICHFLPNTTHGSCRGDNVDLWNEATQKYGWKTAIQTRDEFDNLPNADILPLIGLFTPDVSKVLPMFPFVSTSPTLSVIAHVL